MSQAALNEEVLKLVGLARRAGRISIGYNAVIGAISREDASLLIFSVDYSQGSRRRILLANNTFMSISMGTMAQWGEYFGREEVGVMAITDRKLCIWNSQEIPGG